MFFNIFNLTTTTTMKINITSRKLIDMISDRFIRAGYNTIRTDDIDYITIDGTYTTFNYKHNNASHSFAIIFNIEGLGFEIVPNK